MSGSFCLLRLWVLLDGRYDLRGMCFVTNLCLERQCGILWARSQERVWPKVHTGHTYVAWLNSLLADKIGSDRGCFAPGAMLT